MRSSRKLCITSRTLSVDFTRRMTYRASHMESRPKKVILIVEDERPLVQLLENKFFAAGYDVLTAYDGEEGRAKALDRHPDLILLDVMMPKMDGVTLYNDLRNDPWGKTAKIIFFTNIGDDVAAKRFDEDPNASFLLKADVRAEELIGLVGKELGN